MTKRARRQAQHGGKRGGTKKGTKYGTKIAKSQANEDHTNVLRLQKEYERDLRENQFYDAFPDILLYTNYWLSRAGKAECAKLEKTYGKKKNALKHLYSQAMGDGRAIQKVLETAMGMKNENRRKRYLERKMKKFKSRYINRATDYKKIVGSYPDWLNKEQQAETRKFMGDTSGTLSTKGGLYAVLAAIGMVIAFSAGWMLKPPEEKTTIKEKPVFKDPPLDKLFYIDGVNGTLYENNTLVKNIIGMLETKDIFNDQLIEKMGNLLDEAMKQKDVEMKFYKDGSADATVKKKIGGDDVNITAHLTGDEVRKNVMPKIAGEGVSYFLQPMIEKNATEAVYPIDDSMLPGIKETAGLEGDFNAIKVDFDEKGEISGEIGTYDKETGEFTSLDDITNDQLDKALYQYGDSDEDVDQGWEATKSLLKDNYNKQVKQGFSMLKGKQQAFLKKYDFESLDNATEVLDDLNDLLDMHNATNITKLGDMIVYLKDVNETWNKTLEKYGVKNKTAFYKLVDGWWSLVNETNEFCEKYGEANLTGVGNMITKINWSLQDNMTRLKNIFNYFNVSDAEGVYAKYQDAMDGIKSRDENISDLEKRIRELGAPFTIVNITEDANSTAAWNLLMKQADRAELPVYRLDLTNQSQIAVAKAVFGDTVVGQWLSDGAIEVGIIDGIDSGDLGAAAGLKDSDHLIYTEGVYKATLADGEAALEPYEIDEY